MQAGLALALATWLLALSLAASQAVDLDAAALGVPPGTTKHRFVLTQETPARLRCATTLGDWCTQFHSQEPVPWKPAPRGSKICPATKWGPCNRVGNCNADTGYCECPAGWTGDDCGTPQKRPCTNRVRSCTEADKPVTSHIDENGKDVDIFAPGSTWSRCAGICDDDIGMCYCDGPKGRIPAPKGSPPGTPPVRQGRPMVTPMFQPKYAANGTQLQWGDRAYSDIHGENGWCVSDNPEPLKGICVIDGLDGPNCDQVTEQFCINQCSGHGVCNLGFCKCDEGWYGHDCSRKVAGAPTEEGRIPKHHWLKASVQEPPAAREPPPSPTRKRPLIYVYDLEPLYSSKLLQYRVAGSWCIHRRYHGGNVSFDINNWVYSADTLMHETLLQSEHRTFDPEEADYFYVPQYSVCYIYPIRGWADFPWFMPPASGPRVAGAAMMLMQVHDWISTKFPYWNRRGGRDHIFLFPHDEGACWVPSVLKNATWLTHWGRMDVDHKSHTAYGADNYNDEIKEECMKALPGGWTQYIKGHACYDPSKDLVIPSHKPVGQYASSPLMGHGPFERDILFFFRGDVGKHRLPNYSRGIRQSIYKMAKEGGWAEKHKVLIGDGGDVKGDYSRLLASSKFCLVAPGDGFSARMEDSTLNGCIPVVIMDNVHSTFENILDYSQFAVRVLEKDVLNILQILQAIPEAKVRRMQRALSHVWYRFRWASATQQRREATDLLSRNLKEYDAVRAARLQSKEATAGAGAGRHLLGTTVSGDAASTALSIEAMPPVKGEVIAGQQGNGIRVEEEREGATPSNTVALSQQHARHLEAEGDSVAAALGDAAEMPPAHVKLPRPFRGDVAVDDAFATIMQWLYYRIPHTR